MYIGANSNAGASARPQHAASTLQAGTSDPPPEDEHYPGQNRPSYFRTISSISHGSLASAYQAMRLHDSATSEKVTAAVQEPTEGEAPETQSSGAIESGVGLPGAMQAYGEAMDSSPD